MLYVGCFQFDSVQDGEPLTGGFEVVVEANGPVAAVKAFRRHIEHVRKNNDTLAGDMKIFLGGILEVRRPPRSGVLINWRAQRTSDAHSMISCLTPVDSQAVACYYWRDDSEKPPKNHEDINMRPFLVLKGHRRMSLIPPKIPSKKKARRSR
jgi:hypothetical protein